MRARQTLGGDMKDYRVGVIALASRGGRCVVLVTSRRRARWIFPKGRPEKGRSDRAVARQEAYEEAGLIGEVESEYRELSLEGRSLRLYRMRVSEVLDAWPEMGERKRRIVSPKRAARLLPPDLLPGLRWIR